MADITNYILTLNTDFTTKTSKIVLRSLNFSLYSYAFAHVPLYSYAFAHVPLYRFTLLNDVAKTFVDKISSICLDTHRNFTWSHCG